MLVKSCDCARRRVRGDHAGVDAAAARTGDSNALIDLVNHATQN